MYVNSDNIVNFDRFGVDHILKEIKQFIENKNIIANIYKIQIYVSIICEYFCIGFIDFLLKSKNLLNYTNLVSPNDYEKNDKIKLNYVQ